MKIGFKIEDDEEEQKKKTDELNSKLRTKKITTKKQGKAVKEGKNIIIKVTTIKKFDSGN